MMVASARADINFESDSMGNTIDFGGHIIPGNLDFDEENTSGNIGGSWILLDSLSLGMSKCMFSTL